MNKTHITIPMSIGEVTSSWLTDALRRSGRLGSSEQANVIDIQPLAGGVAYSTMMYRMQLAGPDLPKSAILKLSVTHRMREILDGIGAYAREVAFYRDLGEEVPVRIPEAYVAEFDSATGDMILIIEVLAPLVAVDQLVGLTLVQAEAAVDGLARFHAWSWEHPRLKENVEFIPPMNTQAGRAVLDMFHQFLAMAWPTATQLSGGNMSKDVQVFGNRFSSFIPFFIKNLATPRTIAHGELRGENLFFDNDGSLILIDFQACVQAAGVTDVAYLLTQSLPIEIRHGHDERLVRRYWEGLVSAGVRGYTWDQAWKQYRIGVAYSLLLPGAAFMAYEGTNERGKALLLEMLRRASAAIADNASLDLLPKEPK